ncbi:hypothetical protein ACFW9I_28985 [[Kitasatospora] papulosa]|uniref:hypothetical protein n=1 Tax=[Kitasatospora] papulosa TaxID=1464011 RepID=UPI0036881713
MTTAHLPPSAVITNAARSANDVEAFVHTDAFVPDEGDDEGDSVLALLDPNHELDPADLFDFAGYPGAPDGDGDCDRDRDGDQDLLRGRASKPLRRLIPRLG